jgi:hypothetical protein
MNITNFYGPARFQKFLHPLKEILNNAATVNNPSPFLFASKARDIFFRLEGLCRLYRGLHNKKLFDRLNDDFKEIEDALGVIDYYDAFEKEFQKLQTLPPAFLTYFIEGRNRAQEELNKLLSKKKWISKRSGMINEIESEILKAEWLEPGEERIAIGEFLIKQIGNFTSQYEKGILHFKDIESGLHEFRRKLRWFSIYALVLNGLIQLKKSGIEDAGLKKYLQPEIINSPFNILPEPLQDVQPFYIHDQLFYAMSWVINETGKLKDIGLREEAIHSALKDTGIQTIEVTDTLNINDVAGEQKTPAMICAQAEIIADEFIYKDRVMEKIKKDIYRGMEA